MSARTATDLLNEMLGNQLDYTTEKHEFVLENLAKRTTSPIERVMGMALFYRLTLEDVWMTTFTQDINLGTLPAPSKDGVNLYAQARVGRYTADFLIVAKHKNHLVGIVVECDGHDFHDRTKKQAAHDRQRDRWMALRGLHVMRFTGSEIWADPAQAADDVFEQMALMVGERPERIKI